MGFQIERMSLEVAADVLQRVDSGELEQSTHTDGTTRTRLGHSSEMVAINRAVFLMVTLTA